jgi:hypothetical protein
MNNAELDAWYSGLSEEMRSRVETASTVQIALLFSEQARAKAKEAETDLIEAMNRAEQANEYLKRTTDTLEQAIRLHAIGRR